MVRTEQYKINSECLNRLNNAMDEYFDANFSYKDGVKLRSCKARVFETKNFYILLSYQTFVAVIDKRDNTSVDILRFAYKYTATSAKHIAKFIHDYTPYPWNSPRYTWREI